MRNIIKTSLIAIASAGLLASGCGKDTELRDAAAPAGTEIHEETTLESQCSCECTVCPENRQPAGYMMGSDTKIQVDADYISASSKRINENGDFVQYNLFYDLASQQLSESVFIFKRDGRMLAYADTDKGPSGAEVHDGIVDVVFTIYLWGEGSDEMLERSNDYEANRELFDEADRFLEKTKKEFEHYNSYTVPGEGKLVIGNE
ncbi:MAG: hypothetical protein KJ955_03035 [Nanoarchaeota archaeon]|nr:hypothetical protein [Nanoarchaeota archaeon]